MACSSAHLVVSDGLGEAGTIKLQVDVGELVQELLGLEAVLLGVLHLQVAALGTAQLLQVEVEHGRQTRAQLLRGGNQWKPNMLNSDKKCLI